MVAGKLGLDQVSHPQAWVRVMRLKYISKSSKTKSSQASGVGSFQKPSFSTLGLARATKPLRIAPAPKDTHPAASSPGCFIGVFSAPNKLNLPIAPPNSPQSLYCVTKGKWAHFQATLLENGSRWFLQASAHWHTLSGRPSERDERHLIHVTLDRLSLSRHKLHSKSHGESFR